MDTLQSKIGMRIREFRNAKKYTIEELAHLADLDSTHFSKIERGEINLTIGTLEKILVALGLSPSAFFAFDEAAPIISDPTLEKFMSLMKHMSISEQEALYTTATLFYEKRDHHE